MVKNSEQPQRINRVGSLQPYNSARLIINCNRFKLRLIITTRAYMSSRQRKAILLAYSGPLLETSKQLIHHYRDQITKTCLLRDEYQSCAFAEGDLPLSTYQATNPYSKTKGFGLWLRLARLEMGHTQKTFSKACKISQWQLSRIEKGRAKPSPATFKKIKTLILHEAPELKHFYKGLFINKNHPILDRNTLI